MCVCVHESSGYGLPLRRLRVRVRVRVRARVSRVSCVTLACACMNRVDMDVFVGCERPCTSFNTCLNSQNDHFHTTNSSLK